jgi:uncharacterized membrane protein
MAPWRAGARVALALGYPIAIYAALLWFEPRIVAAALVAFLLLRQRGRAAEGLLQQGVSWAPRAILAGMLLLCVAALVANDETLVRLYPAAVSIALLTVFALSLVYPPSVIERLARLRHPELPPEAVRYTRTVTIVWCVFFVLNTAIAAWTAIYASRETWAVYTGFIAYIAMGTLFAVEWLYRRWQFPHART